MIIFETVSGTDCPYNIYMDNALYLKLCQLQTVPYNIYMNNVWRECNWTVSLQKKITQQNYTKLPKTMQWLLQWPWCRTSRVSLFKLFESTIWKHKL